MPIPQPIVNTNASAPRFAISENVARKTMTSREIGELGESRHDSVKRTIERRVERRAIGSPPMVEDLDGLGRPASEYLICKRQRFVVVPQHTPELTAALVHRWHEPEATDRKR